MKLNDWGARAIWLLTTAAALYAWADFLWPPVEYFRHAQKATPSGVLLELLKPDSKIYPVPGGGYLFILLTIGLAILLVYILRGIGNYLERAFQSLSVIDSEFEVIIQDLDARRATMRRVQNFHANRSGISAYRHTSSLDTPGASQDMKTLKVESFIGSTRITKDILKRKSGSTLEIIDMFNRELPTSLVASLLPSLLVRAMHHNTLLQNVVVNRTFEMDYIDEYASDSPSMQVTAAEFPVTHVALAIDFPDEIAPPKEDISCFIITQGAVRQHDRIWREAGSGRVTYRVEHRNLYKSSLRLQWNNTRLRAAQAQRAAAAAPEPTVKVPPKPKPGPKPKPASKPKAPAAKAAARPKARRTTAPRKKK